MLDITLSDRIRAAHAQADLERLLFLDAIWTRFLENSSSISSDESARIHSLGEELRRLLVRCGDDAVWVDWLLRTHAEQITVGFREAVSKIVSEGGLTDEQQAQFDRLEASGGILAFGRYTKAIPDITAAERASIALKIQNILAGRYTTGDLSDEGTCFLKGGLAVVACFAEPLFGAYIAIEVLHDCF